MLLSRPAGSMKINGFNGGDEAIPAFGKGLDESRIVGGIAQSLAQFVHGDAQAVVEIHRGFCAPKSLLQLLAADYLAWRFQQYREQLKGWLCIRTRIPDRCSSPAFKSASKRPN